MWLYVHITHSDYSHPYPFLAPSQPRPVPTFPTNLFPTFLSFVCCVWFGLWSTDQGHLYDHGLLKCPLDADGPTTGCPTEMHDSNTQNTQNLSVNNSSMGMVGLPEPPLHPWLTIDRSCPSSGNHSSCSFLISPRDYDFPI